jgi:peroxiredoxin
MFSKEIKNTYAGLELNRWLENGRITKIGNPFPFVQLSSIEGKTARLNFKGYATYTLLDFWYSHCGPCIAQFSKLKKIYSTGHSKGFEIIGISVDKKEDVMDYGNAIKKFDLIWRHYWDISGSESKKLGIAIYPSNFLLDKTGKIIAKNISPDELEVFLKRNLNQ